ncbi:MAG: DUF87 domain-containing protein [Desulfobacteraceae bacterium]|nr:DUF87 domain-containing protein [Desulfobacteraceae bacterium]
MQDFEKLGAFYLGREYDLKQRRGRPEVVLYDAKDLTTHAVIIGMTGSGKTGLGIALLEEALIDGIPVIAIDPKGDLANLLLTFPELAAADFEPWVDEGQALTQGATRQEYAARQAERWRSGLAQWGQTPERIGRLRMAAELALYTPGSSAGRPVNVMRSFAAPPAALLQEPDLLQERIQATATSLLSLLGIAAEPFTSREHTLIAAILQAVWLQGRGLDLAGLIHAIQAPPFERIGVMDLEVFFPAKERLGLALRLNALLAAPGFEAWLTGAPLDVGGLLYGPGGKPRAAIFTISHLSDAERMFFVSLLLGEILAWVRTQPGTGSLRAILYMDEIFGFFPPSRNPPAKTPLLTLLKQARAFGLGVVLATQNPVDLDYKGLANTGTWFIGRLQTEGDKQRLLDGLEGAGSGLDRRQIGEVLAGLGQRVFLLHNVHETQPVVFETRWVLSYLRGPMTREEIKRLAAVPAEDGEQAAAQQGPSPPAGPAGEAAAGRPPLAPQGVAAYYLAAAGAGQGLVYSPAVLGRLDIHYSSPRYRVDASQTVAITALLADGPVPLDWDAGFELALDPAQLGDRPPSGAQFLPLPPAARNAAAFKGWEKSLLTWVRQRRPLTLLASKKYQVSSQPGEVENLFRGRLGHVLREKRDLAVEGLRRKYEPRFGVLKNRLLRAEQAVSREQQQVDARKAETAISFGSVLLGAFLGRKAVSAGTTYRLGSALKSAGRMHKEKMDVVRARETVAAVQADLAELDARFAADLAGIEVALDPGAVALETLLVKAKAADITLELFGLVWLPFRRGADGALQAGWRQSASPHGTQPGAARQP